MAFIENPSHNDQVLLYLVEYIVFGLGIRKESTVNEHTPRKLKTLGTKLTFILSLAQLVSTFASTSIQFYQKAMMKPFATPFQTC